MTNPKDLYLGAAILFIFHSNQWNQTEAGRKNNLAPFYEKGISSMIVNVIVYAGNMTKMAAV